MKKINKKTRKITATEFDKIFDEGKEDVVDYLDLKSVRHIHPHPKRVNVDFPEWMVERLDREAKRLGLTRQGIIKVWINDRLTDMPQR